MQGRFKSQRILAGTLHNVITENDKIVEDLGPVKKNQYLEQEQSKIAETSNDTEEKPKAVEKPKIVEEKPSVGLPLISEDGSYVDPSRQSEEKPNTVEKPKVVEEKPSVGLPLISADDNTIVIPNSISQEQKSNSMSEEQKSNGMSQEKKSNSVSEEQKAKSGIHLTPVSLEDLGSILKQEKQNPVEPIPTPKFEKLPELKDNISKIREPVPDKPKPPESIVKQAKPEPKKESKKSHIPIIEPPKPPQIPKITIPKVQINIPTKNEPIKLENVSNKLGDVLANDNYPKQSKTKIVEPSLQKANENILTQQPAITKEKSNKENRRSMSDELDAELLDERKFEQWMKKQKFNENLEKAAQFAQQTKEQFEEKIPELSNRIEDITGEVKGVENKLGAFSSNVDNKLGTFSSNVDNRLGTVDKSIETLCTGIDCVKEDVKKYQTSHDALEKLVQERFSELSEKVQSLERPTFTCENCGEPVIAPLSSYCPNCGSQIQSWSDEDGEPVRGWAPYWKRLGRSVAQ